MQRTTFWFEKMRSPKGKTHAKGCVIVNNMNISFQNTYEGQPSNAQHYVSDNMHTHIISNTTNAQKSVFRNALAPLQN